MKWQEVIVGIGGTLTTALIFSLLLTFTVQASDSLMDIREYMTRTYEVLNVDTNGTNILDTGTVRKFVFDGAWRAYADLGDPRTGKYAVTAGSSGIHIDEGLIWIVGIVLDSNTSFQAMMQVDLTKLDDLNYYSSLEGEQERPRYYIRHGDSINIYPRPGEEDSITVFYFARGEFPSGARSDTVSIIMPSEYRFAVIYASAIYCEVRRRNLDGVGFFEKLYQQEVVRLRSRFELEGKIVEP